MLNTTENIIEKLNIILSNSNSEEDRNSVSSICQEARSLQCQIMNHQESYRNLEKAFKSQEQKDKDCERRHIELLISNLYYKCEKEYYDRASIPKYRMDISLEEFINRKVVNIQKIAKM